MFFSSISYIHMQFVSLLGWRYQNLSVILGEKTSGSAEFIMSSVKHHPRERETRAEKKNNKRNNFRKYN